jgi:hypothetical protein
MFGILHYTTHHTANEARMNPNLKAYPMQSIHTGKTDLKLLQYIIFYSFCFSLCLTKNTWNKVEYTTSKVRKHKADL